MTMVVDQRVVLEGFSIDGLRITRRGLELPEGLPFEEWAQIGQKLYEVEQSIQWLIGDWWNYGDHRYGEMAAQALPEGMAYSTFARYSQVAAEIPLSRRRESLSFSHHSEVVAPGLNADDRERLLDAAAERSLSREEFRQVVRRYRQEIGQHVAEPRPDSLVEEDNEALVTLIGIHAVDDPRLLDVTHNTGAMWVGTGMQPHRMDSNPDMDRQGYLDTVADFREMPFDAGAYDVIVFDPPHATDAGAGLVGDASYGGRYGTSSEELHGHNNVAFLFPGFFSEAQRVLSPNGVVLAKIANMVHDSRYQDQAYMMKQAALEAGFTLCDEMIKGSLQRSGMIDPRWRHMWHVRGAHSYWLVFRKGDVCHKPE